MCSLSALTVLLSACAHVPISTSARQKPANLLTSSHAAQEEYSERIAAISALCGDAKIKVRAGLQRIIFSQEIIAARPRYLRIETLTPLGHASSILTSNDQTLAFYDAGEGSIRRVPPTAEGVKMLFPIDISPEEFVRVALAVPYCPLQQLDKMDYENSTNTYRLVYAAGTLQECSIWVDPTQFYPLKYQLKREDDTFSAYFRGFIPIHTTAGPARGEKIIWFPQEILLVWEGKEDQKMTIAWQKTDLNCKTSPEAFSLPLPAE
ncbi:MAG: hypothetical protein HY391_00510 [Deltaproteobacteria bacterium]|nr:hypothetical protein [Deltaproteobacteria bacterium]